MTADLTHAHNFLSSNDVQQALRETKRGIEKEGLRVNVDKPALATTPHPQVLGSALTNSWVTTDFSEALLEYITPALSGTTDVLDFLSATHYLTAEQSPSELVWPGSMPCLLPADDEIPLAQYGSSNLAQMKTVYRRGLGHRYGRAMQTVAGIHYNFSLPDSYWQLEAESHGREFNRQYVDERYLALIRNFRRYYWLLIYLFGASPCADASFVDGRSHNLKITAEGDLYLPHATSLRMGDLGYQSIAQKSLFVCYNELQSYVDTLSKAMHTPYPPYNIFGLEVDGEYQQLSTGLLQIENEFYSAVRPKRVTNSGETPLDALSDRGIEYIEVRCLDLSPFDPIGISASDAQFIDTFLLTCLLLDSPCCDQNEFAQIGENQARVVNYGRCPSIEVFDNGTLTPLATAASKLLKTCGDVAIQLDKATKTGNHVKAVQLQQEKVDDNANTPSAKILQELNSTGGRYVDYMHELAKQHRRQHLNSAPSPALADKLNAEAIASHQKQRDIEASDTVSFSQFLKNYFDA